MSGSHITMDILVSQSNLYCHIKQVLVLESASSGIVDLLDQLGGWATRKTHSSPHFKMQEVQLCTDASFSTL